MTDPLQSAAYATLGRFGRIGASYPVYFEAPAGYEVVAAEEMLQVDSLRGYFARAVSEWSDHPSEEDQRAAASRFLRRYVGSLAGAALMSLSAGVALDVAISRVQILVRANLTLGAVVDLAGATVSVSADRPTGWPVEKLVASSAAVVSVPGEQLRHRAYESLFGDHLVPVFERVHSVIGVSERLMWTTAAESIEYMYENGRPNFDDAGWAPIAVDRAVVHFADTVPGVAGPNPMKGLLEWEDSDDPEVPGPVEVRRVCCVNYIVPGRGTNKSDPTSGYCRNCGLLTAEQRLHKWREYLIQHREETLCRWPPLG